MHQNFDGPGSDQPTYSGRLNGRLAADYC